MQSNRFPRSAEQGYAVPPHGAAAVATDLLNLISKHGMKRNPEITALVEISPSLCTEVQRDRLRWAYRRSRHGLVILVLHDVTVNEVNRLLDPIVAEEGNGAYGVLFLDFDDDGMMEKAIAARRVLPATPAFRQRVAAWRTRGSDPDGSVAEPVFHFR